MSIQSAYSFELNTKEAFAQTYQDVCRRLGGEPDYITVLYGEDHDPEILAQAANDIPDSVKVIGGGTNNGLMTEEGVFQGTSVMGMLGIRHQETQFGIALRPKSQDMYAVAQETLRAALADIGRSGETPELVFLLQTPGDNEEILQGITDILGHHVPVHGGGTSCNALIKRWSVITRGQHAEDGLVIAVMFGALKNASFFQGGGVPSSYGGTITETSGPRVIRKIDGRPAFDVYQEWYVGQFGKLAPEDETLRTEIMLTPLGRQVGRIDDSSNNNPCRKDLGLYSILSILSVGPEREIEVLVNIQNGDELRMMVATEDILAMRPARGFLTALEAHRLEGRDHIHGASIIYCAGLSRLQGHQLEKVHKNICNVLQGVPFLAGFYYGEYGTLKDIGTFYGNLMVSTLVFGS